MSAITSPFISSAVPFFCHFQIDFNDGAKKYFLNHGYESLHSLSVQVHYL